MIPLIRPIAVIGLAAALAGALSAQTSKPAGKVSLRTNEVSLVTIAEGAEKCPNNEGTTARLKVSGQNTIDVLVRYRVGLSTVNKPFLDQAPGSEISVYQCAPRAQFEVFSRPKGSTADWAKVK